MATWRPDPTFYPSPRLAASAPPERLAYVATMNPRTAYPEGARAVHSRAVAGDWRGRRGDGGDQRPDALVVVDVDPGPPPTGRLVGRAEMPNAGDEFHHFGWNACSSALCPYAPHPHVERRYLIVPGLRSSRIYVLDTRPDPRRPRLVKTIEPEEVARRTGYSRLHTVHCGPEGIYVGALGAPDGRGPGGRLPARPRQLRRPGAAGRSTGARSTWPTTSPGTWATTPCSPASGARPTWWRGASSPTSS